LCVLIASLLLGFGFSLLNNSGCLGFLRLEVLTYCLSSKHSNLLSSSTCFLGSICSGPANVAGGSTVDITHRLASLQSLCLDVLPACVCRRLLLGCLRWFHRRPLGRPNDSEVHGPVLGFCVPLEVLAFGPGHLLGILLDSGLLHHSKASSLTRNGRSLLPASAKATGSLESGERRISR